MTVAKIKEYIAEQENISYQELLDRNIKMDTKDHINVLDNIKSMLDELETPIEIDTKKYFEQIDKLVDRKMAQYLKDQMKKALKKEIERSKYVRD